MACVGVGHILLSSLTHHPQAVDKQSNSTQPWDLNVIIILNQTLNPLLPCICRGRHERTRTRTRERALLTLQQLAETAAAPQPHVTSRMRYAFSVAAPYAGVLRRELGEQLVSAGMVGAAMTIFEELELWDNLILCYLLLEKKPQVCQVPVPGTLDVKFVCPRWKLHDKLG